MTLDQAIGILGINRTREGDIRPMVKALALHEWMNDADDRARLAAGRHVLRNWNSYAAECNRRRDLRSARRG